MIHLENIVALGLAVPEQISDGRKTVCLAAYHEDLRLIRIYPCRADMGLNRWRKFSAYVERNPQDTRMESFKLVGSKDQWDSLSVTTGSLLSRTDRAILLDKIVNSTGSCVKEINSIRFSLGLIKPYAIHDVYLADNPTYLKPIQHGIALMEADGWVKTKANYPFQPRIKYQCTPTCPGHDQSILEWGAFEWMRQNPGREHQLIDNWRLRDANYHHYLLVGNQASHRNSFVVINLINVKREMSKFPSLVQDDLFAVK